MKQQHIDAKKRAERAIEEANELLVVIGASDHGGE